MNSFINNPPKVVIYDPVTATNTHTYCFLGDVPKGIWNACNYYREVTAAQRQAYDKLLREFYGADYKYHVAIAQTRVGGGVGVGVGIGGGADDLDDSDIEKMLQGEREVVETVAKNVGGVTYPPVHVYPEDKFSEFKEKIYIATGIPVYRQHLFYIDKNRLQGVYKISVEGAYKVDIRDYNNFRDIIHGVHVDRFLYDNRNSLKIEANDTFEILSSLPANNTVYVVDLAQFTAKIRTQLLDMISDTYQFELFYYGFIVKYWPQLTTDCFYDYITNEDELQHKYPDLAKNKSSLVSVYKTESEIIDGNYRNMNKMLAFANDNVAIAITQMIAMVSGNRVMLNIRNLFDKLRVTKCIPEIHAYIEHNNKRYLLRKRYIRSSDIQFPSGMLMRVGITLAISLRKSDQDVYHSRSTATTMENEQSRFMFLNFHPNGKYYIKTLWNEEDELGFDDIIKIMKKFTDPIIHGINQLGRYAFIAGSSLPLITKQNVGYQGLNICVYWKKVMLEHTFKTIKGLWDTYLRARIIGTRNVQQFDKYEFTWRKGMYEFDTNAIERIITASNNIIINNYYVYLSNNAVKQKWNQNYDGRVVRMTHRTTDVRFEIIDIREQEFQTFYTYVLGFIYRAINTESIKTAFTATKNYKDVKKLRKLLEQDPELYNLKKYGSKKVYSSVCQRKRQPIIYTPDELKTMDQTSIKKLTQYWNFTMNKPAWYGCPTKQYPHLSFGADAHPKHYCLPCCNKKPHTSEGSKKSRLHAVCVSKHKFTNEESGVSRHIMNYGKDIDLARLSKLPQAGIKNLLMGTVNTPHNYYIYGVPQDVPGAENIGIVYAVAESLNIPMEELVKKLIIELKKPESKHLFGTLLNGTLVEYWSSADAMIATIKEIFVDGKMFSQEMQKFKQWPELFTELFHIFFKISIFTFLDDTGTGANIELFIPDILYSEIAYVNRMNDGSSPDDADSTRAPKPTLVSSLMAEQIYVLVIKKQNRYYPIFVIDVETYFKTFNISQRKYVFDDKVIKLIYNMVAVTQTDETYDKKMDLSLLKEFIAESGYTMVTKYINRQNLCYAALLSRRDQYVYVPIDYSVYISDKIPVSFDAYVRDNRVHVDGVRKFITEMNAFIEAKYKAGNVYLYGLLKEQSTLTLGGKFTGLEVSGMNFYCEGEISASSKIRELRYSYDEINKLILSRAPPVPDPRTTKIGESLYNNYIYQLFVIEFINYLDIERNAQTRSKIKALINETNFKKDINDFRKQLREILQNYPHDYSLIQNQITTFYYSHFNKVELLENIDATVYDFDRVTMNKLRSMSRDDMKKELLNIASTFSVQKDFDTAGIKFPNVYMPCREMTDIGYCEKNKLILNRPIDDLVDILTTDLTDSLKSKYLLNNIWQDTVLDPLKFTKWPTEIINIYRLE